ncbi:hypothetical protein [Litchfieldia salsa]|uniref:Uncharacterized protein n=1 Tax=Litchfieldia salsa TaxID=930152 RepID=A0A1H0WFQ8_9BACI|nr:hypothetical protein [Litchfieldia salsa]SDP89560.1 hypothetical protein SAMN05216565_11141 [Litchfieldia salsa]
MRKKIIQLLIGFISGCLLVKYMNITFPLRLEEVVINFLLSPMDFFIVMICFIISFVFHAIFIAESIENTYLLINGVRVPFRNTLLCYSVFISFFILSLLAVWDAILILAFSILYGLLSVDYNYLKTNRR